MEPVHINLREEMALQVGRLLLMPDVQCNIGELNQVFEPLRLQQRAHRMAAAARSFCEETALADDAMLAGMFHNIGYWILLQECAPELRRACDVARAEGIALHEAENRIIGTSHAEVGAYLLGLWGLPHAVIEAHRFGDGHLKSLNTPFGWTEARQRIAATAGESQ